MNKKIPIARIGKTNGINGYLKLNILSDFPEQFKVGTTFQSDKISLTIENFINGRNLIKFKNFDNPEDAKQLTNKFLYATEEETRKNCNLKEDEYFWFDIIGCEVIENEKKLGVVEDISRINESDYLIVSTDEKLISEGFSKRFMLEFKRHKEKVDIENKKIFVKDGFIILETS